MTSTTDSQSPAREEVVRRHPIRGALWGALLGLGVAIYLVLFAVIPFGDWAPLAAVVLGFCVLGALWGYLAPPKRRKAEDDVRPAGRAEPDDDDDTPSGVGGDVTEAPTDPLRRDDLDLDLDPDTAGGTDAGGDAGGDAGDAGGDGGD